MTSAPSKVMIREANSQLVMMHQKISDLESSLVSSRDELSVVQDELDKTRAMVKCQEHIAQEKEAAVQEKEALQHTQLVQYQEQCQKQLDAMKHHCKTQLTDLTTLLATSQSSLAVSQSSLTDTQSELQHTQSELQHTQSELTLANGQVDRLEGELKEVIRRGDEAQSKASKLDVLLASESTLRSLLAVIELMSPPKAVQEIVEECEIAVECEIVEKCEVLDETPTPDVEEVVAIVVEQEMAQTESCEASDEVEVSDIEVAVTAASEAVKEIEAVVLEADISVEEEQSVAGISVEDAVEKPVAEEAIPVAMEVVEEVKAEVVQRVPGVAVQIVQEEVTPEEVEEKELVQDEVAETVEVVQNEAEVVEPKEEFYECNESKDEIETDRATIDTNSTFGELLDLTQEPEWGTQNNVEAEEQGPDENMNSREASGESGGSTEGWEKDSMSFPESSTTDSSYLNVEQPEIQSVDEDQSLEGEEEEGEVELPAEEVELPEVDNQTLNQNMNTVFNINSSTVTPSLMNSNTALPLEVTESLYSESNANESVV